MTKHPAAGGIYMALRLGLLVSRGDFSPLEGKDEIFMTLEQLK